MDLATLKRLKPSEFEEAADGYRATANMASTAKDDIDNVVVAGMRKSLKGEALEAAVGELKKLSANFHYVQIECGLVSTALNGFAYDMGPARKKLMDALDDAAAKGFSVGADGSVTYPAGAPKGGGSRRRAARSPGPATRTPGLRASRRPTSTSTPTMPRLWT